MNPSIKSFLNPGSVSASVESLASASGIRDEPTGAPHTNDFAAQGSPHSLSTSISSLESSGSLPSHQQQPGGDPILGLFHRHNLDGVIHSSPSNRSQLRNHSRTHSTQSHQSLTMTSRTPSESNSQFYMPPPAPYYSVGRINNSLFLSDSLISGGSTLTPSHPTIRTNTVLFPQSHGSTYLSSPNDTTEGGPDSPVVGPSNWASPPMRAQSHPVVSTSVSSSSGALTSPTSLASPLNVNQPSPTYPLPPQQQQQQQQQQQRQQEQPPPQKPKKEKHAFGTATAFLTETLPTLPAGMRLYPGSKKNSKAQGDAQSSSSSTHNGKGKKSGSGGPLGSINTRKQQSVPGANSTPAGDRDRAIASFNSAAGAVAGTLPHHATSPIARNNNHSSLDAKVMAREMAVGHSTEDVWQALCIKVLTLFNGQGLTGAIEDLNDLVRRCLLTRTPFMLCDEIHELLNNGMLTLNAKLGDVPDEKLVSRLVEVWSFFFGTVLPYFEGVFLPLQIELKNCHAKKMVRKAVGGNGGPSVLTTSTGSSTTLSSLITGGMETSSVSGMVGASSKSIASDAERSCEDSEPENVRTMALTGFRDLVILPMVDRLGGVFVNLFHDMDTSIPVADTAARMLQMTSVLTSIQSNDEQQFLMEQVSNRLRTNWKQFTRKGNRGAFIGRERRIAPAQQAR